jgi:hypothetical protein
MAMLLKLNQAQVQVLSDALVQYLQGAGGQGIAGDKVTLAERLLERLNERAPEQAAQRGAAADPEVMRKADRTIEHHARLKQEREELIDKTIAERIATDRASLERHQEMMRKQIARFAKAGRLGR